MVVGEAEQDSVERCKADGTHLGASRHEYGPAWVRSHLELQLCSSAQFQFSTKRQCRVQCATSRTGLQAILGCQRDVSLSIRSNKRRQKDTTKELGEDCASLYESSFDITRYHRPGFETARHLRRSSGRLDPPAQVPGRKVRIVRGRFATRLEIETFLVKAFCGEDDPFGSELSTFRVIAD
jgi:hypothetical protein